MSNRAVADKTGDHRLSDAYDALDSAIYSATTMLLFGDT